MIKKLSAHGNSSAVIIDKPILDMLKITPKTSLELSTDGVNIIISPVRGKARDGEFRQALESVNRAHAKTLKKLAE